MRSAIFWLMGASLAFFVTAGAFLVLANFGTAPKANDSITRPESSGGEPRGPQLALNFSEEGLQGLRRSQGQTVTLYLENRGEKDLESVNLELAVSSEDTTRPGTRRYSEGITRLAPGEREAVDITVNLSPPPPVGGFAVLDEGPESDREILEARAYAPGQSPVVKTAIVSP